MKLISLLVFLALIALELPEAVKGGDRANARRDARAGRHPVRDRGHVGDRMVMDDAKALRAAQLQRFLSTKKVVNVERKQVRNGSAIALPRLCALQHLNRYKIYTWIPQ